MAIVLDPPDPDYTNLAEPTALSFGTSADDTAANELGLALDSFYDSAASALGNQRAAYTTINRFSAAAEAGDLESSKMQEDHLISLPDDAGSYFGAMADSGLLVSSLIENTDLDITVTDDEIFDFDSSLMSEGIDFLPSIERDIISQLDFDSYLSNIFTNTLFGNLEAASTFSVAEAWALNSEGYRTLSSTYASASSVAPVPIGGSLTFMMTFIMMLYAIRRKISPSI